MKIFYTVSKSGIKDNRQIYERVLSEVKRQKIFVEATLGKSYLSKNKRLKTVKDLALSEDKFRYAHDKAVRSAIFRSDAVVIEASYPSFRLGFEAFLALSQQKPVLVLSKYHNYSRLIDHPHFFGAQYSDFTLPDEVEKFIKHVRLYKLRNRFNLFVSDNQKKYLKERSKQYGVTMSDYIRKLIEQDKRQEV